MPNSFVAATHPNIKGMAPGKAPTNTDNEVFCFNGVYTQAYKKMDKLAKKAVLRFIKYRVETPTKVKTTPINKAVLDCIRPAGNGRF